MNIELPEGREIFKRLVESADFVIESFEPGYMDSLGLGYPELERIKPDLIMTSITPFGETGPYAHYQATDLIGLAMGGLVRILGEPGRPPVRMTCDPQAYFQASIHGALGSVVAHYHRQLTGEGQHVDVSMQQAVILGLLNAVEIYEAMKINLSGMGQFYVTVRPAPLGPLISRLIFPCKDGHVVCVFGGGAFGGARQSSEALVEWANQEGMAMEFKDYDLSQWDASTMTQEESDRRLGVISDFLKMKTKSELYEESVKRGIMLAPCNTVEDIIRNEQLEARDFWERVEHPELEETITYPGAPLKIKETPWRIQRRAPLIGEHNQEVYGKGLGLSREQMILLKARNVI